ncbi:MAG TPA: CBS domain-containing protein [Burkholderiaceae bacterium]|jgi:CBS domain-containing protein
MTDRMTAGAVCRHDVIVGYPSLSVSEAARLMREEHVGCLVVVEEDEPGRRRVAGLLTDRDIVTAVVAKDLDATTLRVGDVMSTDLAVAREDDSVLDLVAQMRHRGVRRLPVTGAQDLLVGLVTLDDLLGVLHRQLGEAVQAIAGERERERARRP